jgi:LysR family cyn operon transcriptional activator
MNLRHLRTFVAIADAGGVARATERVHLSQPAVSRQILALEAELGVRLFDRVGRRIRLTSEGEDMLQRSRRLLAEAESLSERARVLTAGQTGLLRIGATPQVIEHLLTAFLPRYRRRFPGVEIHLLEDASGRLATYLDQGDVHLAQMPTSDGRFPSRPVYPIHLLAVVPRGHRLSRRRTLDVTELAEEPLLVLRRHWLARQWIEAAYRVAHVRPPILFESSAPQTLIALTGAEYGIAVVPSNVVIAQRSVRPVPLVLRGASLGAWTSLAWHPQRFLPPYAQKFVDEYVAFARRNNPGQAVIRHAPPLPRPSETAA